MVSRFVAVLMMIVLGFSSAASAAPLCVTPIEAKADKLRQLQTEMMVAALKCRQYRTDFPDKYNAFIGRFGEPLATNAKTLKAFFSRAYGKDHARRFDAYITSLANQASLRSMQEVGYCENVVSLFESALAVAKADELDDVAGRLTSSGLGGKVCSANPKTANKKSH